MRTAQRFRKKSVVVEALQWGGFGDPFTFAEVVPLEARFFAPCNGCRGQFEGHGWLNTLEGGHRVCPGDWIIKGVKGEFYPCKPDIFEATYEAAP